MGLLTFSCTSDRVSYAVHKRPDKVLCRSIRNGVAVLWFPNPESIVIYFVDNADDSSFSVSEKDSSYLNLGRYSGSLMYLALMSTFFKDVLQGKRGGEEDDVSGPMVLKFSSLRVSTRCVDFFRRQLAGRIYFAFCPQPTELSPTVPRVTTGMELQTNTLSLVQLFQTAAIFLLLNANMSGEARDLPDKDCVKRYATMVREVDLPYHLRAKFVERVVGHRSNVLEANREALEGSERYQSLMFLLGNSQNHRYQFVLKAAKASGFLPVLDVGCGEGYYIPTLAEKTSFYIGHDKDSDVLEKAREKASRNKLPAEKVCLTTDKKEAFAAADRFPGVFVLCTEVIEHMEREEASGLLADILTQRCMRTVLVTTPNRSFNKHYAMGGEFRHDDHKWEMTMPEFESFIGQVLLAFPGWGTVVYHHVGNMVDGEGVSLGAVITRCSDGVNRSTDSD
jgi:small RNA 2'-O-methyltransferase